MHIDDVIDASHVERVSKELELYHFGRISINTRAAKA
jgi:hypothetical protein